MVGQHDFEFRRARGIVWVCDLVNSSRFLNDNSAVDALEQFLPRLNWLGMAAVEAAGGQFIKWTGDGFLAWFETPLHRQMFPTAEKVFQAIWYFSSAVNITELGVGSNRNFRVRHGVTYEQDAFLTTIRQTVGNSSFDIMGRNVVLAFRALSYPSAFPHVVTENAVLNGRKHVGGADFSRWKVTENDLSKYFKGERWGTNSLYVSTSDQPRRRTKSVESVKRAAVKAIRLYERGAVEDAAQPDEHSVHYRLFQALSTGPQWAQQVAADYTTFVRDKLLGSLKQAVAALEEIQRNNRLNSECA